MEYWHEALTSKYEDRDRKYGKLEFEKLLEGYTVRHVPLTLYKRAFSSTAVCLDDLALTSSFSRLLPMHLVSYLQMNCYRHIRTLR